MIKLNLCIIFLLLICFPSSASVFNFDEFEADENLNLTGFEEIYIQNIDLRDLKVSRMVDPDDNNSAVRTQAEESVLDQQTLESIAFDMYESFLTALSPIIPVKDIEVKDADKKALLMDLKLTGDFKVQEQRPLTKLLMGANRSTANLTLQCTVLDAKTGTQILKIKDSQEFADIDSVHPFVASKDREQLFTLIETWAAQLAQVFKDKR